ncbi:polynucleotide 5'-hydroxyl-kinase NOL9 [Hyposmocoma kahamanoa]|uniref:polynucleotide 5'-hydroxyl-kinase NOL9 n=1 Tax=Hyposmocoma kahamanoa TaxID=1477025 RepID=UPI000E6D5D69|nr:polynucleotide 5'-hydroxyl-kinase NOL9 [Hyposmocoma kahamanoa]
MKESNDPTPFVSILAANVPSQSLSDVLGDYCHPTVRNVPFESQNINSIDNSGIFTTEDENITDLVEPNDEIGSLIPEIDNTETVDDMEIPTDLDTSSQNPNEESTVYDETLQSEDITEKEESLDSINPVIINPIKVYYGKKSCILVMKHPAQVYMHGKVKVKSLGGTVEIFGYTLQENTYDIYAPHYNFAQSIKTVENANAFYGLFGKLTASGLSVSDAEEVVTSIGEHDAVIYLQPLTSRKIEFVQTNFNVTDLFSKQNRNVDNCLKKASNLLGCSLYLSKPLKSLQEPVSWKQVIQYGLADHISKGIICGGKGAGKSTFLRYYVNKLLVQGPVLVIDLDPGQCEFTVAGNVSATVVTEPLLGPNFTHLGIPELSLHVAMINTMDHPKRYVNAVEMLISYCYIDERLKTMPWVVNTMGMTNALGLKFIALTILKIKPTFLLQIDSKNEKKRFDFHLYPQTVRNLYFEDFQNDPFFKNITESQVDYKFLISHHTEKSPKNNFSLAPRDERYLNYLAYFGELLDTHSGDILGIVPYEVDLKDIAVVLNVKISGDVVSAVWNGKVVSLCSSDQKAGVSTLADEPLQWHGCGLIRGNDVEKGKVYIITPTPDFQLSNVNTVAYADWVPELRGLERTLPPDTQVPYRTASVYHHRQLMFTPKRRFNPLQLLKMSRSS